MDVILRMWLIMGGICGAATGFVYMITVGTPLVYATILFPGILLGVGLPIQRWVNQINNGIKRQNGKCYNCNLPFIDKDQATLEDDNHVYCRSCDIAIFGEPIVKDGIEYRNDSKDRDKK